MRFLDFFFLIKGGSALHPYGKSLVKSMKPIEGLDSQFILRWESALKDFVYGVLHIVVSDGV